MTIIKVEKGQENHKAKYCLSQWQHILRYGTLLAIK